MTISLKSSFRVSLVQYTVAFDVSIVSYLCLYVLDYKSTYYSYILRAFTTTM